MPTSSGTYEIVFKETAVGACRSVFVGCRIAVAIVTFFDAVMMHRVQERARISYMVGYEAGRITGVLMTNREAYELGREAGGASEAYKGTAT